MPGPNPRDVGKNIAFYTREGRPRQQAIAIAMSRRRKAAGENENEGRVPKRPMPATTPIRKRPVTSGAGPPTNEDYRFSKGSFSTRHPRLPGVTGTPISPETYRSQKSPRVTSGNVNKARQLRFLQAKRRLAGKTPSRQHMELPDFASLQKGDLDQLKAILTSKAQRRTPATRPSGDEVRKRKGPSARAYERANPRARFKRTQAGSVQSEALRRKLAQARKARKRLKVTPGPRGTQF